MTLLFELTMPNRGSWNGRWSGESRSHYLIKTLSNSQKNLDRGQQMNGKSWYYAWPDGWGANVSCKVIEGRLANTFRRLSDGFCGYDWMVESILKYDKILADHQITEADKERVLR